MERVISTDERIRRAEEIYLRRKKQKSGLSKNYTYRDKKEKIKSNVTKKIILQICICVIAYGSLYVAKNSNNIFSKDYINKVHEVLQYDINIPQYYKSVKEYFINKIQKTNNEIKEDNSQSEENCDNVENVINESIGGAIEENQETEIKEENLSQMEIDANYVKENFKFIKPLEGTITSRFGQRDPTTASVPKYHTGIDIAANTGTPISAALDGIVEVSSSKGDYGQHLKIKNNDVELVYAHCSKLCKKEGDEVKQGEKIAEVGETRKCDRTAFTF